MSVPFSNDFSSSFSTNMNKPTYLNYNPYLLVVHSKSPIKKYEKIDINRVSKKEDNDLRLFSAELNFLNLKYNPTKDKKSICIYIGSSSGNHIPKLISFYPELEYHCYDPIEPSHQLKSFAEKSNFAKVLIFQKFFTEEDIIQYQNIDADIYVITDFENHNIKSDLEIKKAPNSLELRKEKESFLSEDMELQMKWMKLLKPKEACLKFRLPHYYENVSTVDTFSYFQGIVYRTIFSSLKTSECRLFVSDFESTTLWNFKRFDEQMYYYNDVTREKLVVNPITNSESPFYIYGNTFDQMVFFWILKDYFITRSHVNVKSAELISLYNFIIS